MQFCNPRQGNAVVGTWALDNDCFNKPFDKARFDAFLARNIDKKASCLFIVMPDVVGDAAGTLRLWEEFSPQYTGWPLAFVAQDGQENLELPKGSWDCLFIGGSTDWKLGDGAMTCVRRGVELGKHIHVGRVNSYRRFKMFAMLEGEKEFTCDGTKQRFCGRDQALEIYNGFEEKFRRFRDSLLSGGDSGRQYPGGGIRPRHIDS